MESSFSTSLTSCQAALSRSGMLTTDDTDKCDDDDDDDGDGDGWVDLESEIDEKIELLQSVDGEDPE